MGGSTLMGLAKVGRPTAIQPPFTMKGEFGLIQKGLTTDKYFPVFGEARLNLVVTVAEGTTLTSKLPVFVWYDRLIQR